MPTHETFNKRQNFTEMKYGDESCEIKPLRIEVFGDFKHKKVADDLHKVLKESGFLDKHPLFKIRVDTIEGYQLT